MHSVYVFWSQWRVGLAAKRSPFGPHGFFARVWAIKQAPLTAFATSSSAATLPVTIEVNLSTGISSGVADFVLPLGAAVNLDGTALGFPIMVMFGAQLFDYAVPFAQQIAVAAVGVMCSIGAAPIPNAGLVYLVLLLSTAGGILETQGAQETVVALIFALDWFVDRVETAANVFSDCMVVHMLDQRQQAEAQVAEVPHKPQAAQTLGDVEDPDIPFSGEGRV